MRKKYVNPICAIVDLMNEGMIANSFDKINGHADGNFIELTKEKDKENSLWGDEGTIWK